MNRIFTPLVAFAALFMLATAVLGLSLRLYDIRDASDLDAQAWAAWHRQAGVMAALVVAFVNSIVVTYFVGTSRWCKEVVEAYSLSPEYVLRSNRLKRGTFPYALLGILAMVGVVALGGAADPAARLQLPPVSGLTWTNFHFVGATLALCFILYTAFIEAHNIRQNHVVISEVMAQVQQIRKQRGLDD
ncbi:MAG TPA: hypothetical protein VHC19_23315 [Pirellulales bacterium]|jgi:hypothetical protein|nr:hypothetical protein [Pirellulales bacterium]